MTLYQWLFWGFTLVGTGTGRALGDTLSGFLIGAGVGIFSAFFFIYMEPPKRR